MGGGASKGGRQVAPKKESLAEDSPSGGFRFADKQLIAALLSAAAPIVLQRTQTS
jgi:hypothetical protein